VLEVDDGDHAGLWQPQRVEKCSADLAPTVVREAGDPRFVEVAVDGSYPLRLENAGAGQPFIRSEPNLPGKASLVCRQGYDRDLRHGGNSLRPTEDENRPPLVSGT
jgi:hypothetical protein